MALARHELFMTGRTTKTQHYLQLIIDNCIQFSYTAKSVYIWGCAFPETLFHAVLKERDHA